MIRGAAGADGILFEHAQRRRRLSRVEDRDASACRFDELPRSRRDPRQPLQEIEGGALRDKQRPRGTDDFGRFLAGSTARAVLLARGPLAFRIDLTKYLGRDLDAGKHAVGLHEENTARARVGGDRRAGRHIARADVFFECAAHDVAIRGGIERPHELGVS